MGKTTGFLEFNRNTPNRKIVMERIKDWNEIYEAWPEEKVACEVQGGVWVGGRHNRGKGYENDCDKLNLSQLEGWLLLYVTTTHIARGDAAELIRKALKVRKLKPPFYNDGDVV